MPLEEQDSEAHRQHWPRYRYWLICKRSLTWAGCREPSFTGSCVRAASLGGSLRAGHKQTRAKFTYSSLLLIRWTVKAGVQMSQQRPARSFNSFLRTADAASSSFTIDCPLVLGQLSICLSQVEHFLSHLDITYDQLPTHLQSSELWLLANWSLEWEKNSPNSWEASWAQLNENLRRVLEKRKPVGE